MNLSRLRALTPALLAVKLALLLGVSPFVASFAGCGLGLAVLVTSWYLFLRPRIDLV